MINFCTKNTRGRGRVIKRSEYSRYVEQNRKNIEKYEHFYKRRQAIVEHPYGTIKRQWGFSYILTKKGKDRASADVGFMLTAYNLKRIINILGQDVLRKYLERLVLLFSAIMLNIKLIISHFNIPKSFMNLKLISVAKISNRIIFENNKYKNGGF